MMNEKAHIVRNAFVKGPKDGAPMITMPVCSRADATSSSSRPGKEKEALETPATSGLATGAGVPTRQRNLSRTAAVLDVFTHKSLRGDV